MSKRIIRNSVIVLNSIASNNNGNDDENKNPKDDNDEVEGILKKDAQNKKVHKKDGLKKPNKVHKKEFRKKDILKKDILKKDQKYSALTWILRMSFIHLLRQTQSQKLILSRQMFFYLCAQTR